MNKEIYLALCDRISKKCPDIRWIDWDEGQLNVSGERQTVDFPCCLIDINYASCRDLTDKEQFVNVNIAIKLAVKPMGETYAKAPEEAREKALKHFDMMEELHAALQGCELGGICSALSRVSAIKNVRANRIIIYTLRYDTTFQEVEN